MQTRHLLPKLYQIDLEQQARKYRVRNQLMTSCWYEGKLYVLTRCFGDLVNIEKQQNISQKMYIEIYDDDLKQLERRLAPVQSNSISFKIIGRGEHQFVISDDCIFSMFNEHQRLIVDPQLIGASFLHTATTCPNGLFLLVSFDKFLAVVRINDEGLELASKLDCQPLKTLAHIGEDDYIGLAPEFNEDEEEEDKINFYFFSATRMDLKLLENNFVADYCANEDTLDINMQEILLFSNECEVNLSKKALYLTYGRMKSIAETDQPEMILPCLACIDVTDRTNPEFNYAISSVGVVLSAAVSPFLLKSEDDYGELVVVSDSFGFVSLCFGTCRFQDHRILHVNTKMAVKQIQFGWREAASEEDSVTVYFPMGAEEVQAKQIYRYCFITLLGESDVPYIDEGHLLFAKTNYTILSELKLDMEEIEQINDAPTAVAQQAEINGEAVDEFSNFDIEIPELDEESHYSCAEDNETSIEQAFSIIRDRIIRRLLDPTCTINNDDSFENVDIDQTIPVEKSISRLIGSAAPSEQGLPTQSGTSQPISAQPTSLPTATASTAILTTSQAPMVNNSAVSPEGVVTTSVSETVQVVLSSNQVYPPPLAPSIDWPRAYEFADGDTIEFVKLLQQDDDSCYVMKLGGQFIVLGGQPSTVVVNQTGNILLGTVNGLVYFLQRKPLHICYGPMHFGQAVIGFGLRQLTFRMEINEVTDDIFKDFYVITFEEIFRIVDKQQSERTPIALDCGSFLAFDRGLLGVSQEIIVVSDQKSHIFPMQALLSLGSEFELVQSVLWNSIIPRDILERFSRLNENTKINYKVYDVIKSDTEVKDVMLLSAIQLLIQWALIEAKEFDNWQVLQDTLKWAHNRCDEQLFSSILDTLDEQNERIRGMIEDWVKQHVAQ